MKKISIMLPLMMIPSFLFCQTIYLEADYLSSIKDYEDSIKENVEENESDEDDFYSQYFKSMGFVDVSGGGKKAGGRKQANSFFSDEQEKEMYEFDLMRKKIGDRIISEGKKNGLDVVPLGSDDKQKYPVVSFFTEWGYNGIDVRLTYRSKSDESFTANSFYPNEEDYKNLLSENDGGKFALFVAKFVQGMCVSQGIVSLENGSSHSAEPPLKLDQLGSRIVSIAARDDLSFVALSYDNDNPRLDLYGKAGNIEGNLMNLVSESDLKKTQMWTLGSDGKNFIVCSSEVKNVYSFKNSTSRPERIKYNYETEDFGFCFLTESGVPYLFGMNSRELVIGGKGSQPQKNIDFAKFTNPYRFIISRDNSISYLSGNTLIKFSPEGNINEVAVIQSGEDFFGSERLATVNEDDSFCVITSSEFLCFNPDGTLRWKLPMPSGTSFLDYSSGVYYFSNGNRNLVRYVDAGNENLPGFMKTLVDCNSRLAKDAVKNIPVYHELAELYMENEGFDAALEYFEKYLDLCPADGNALEKKLSIEVEIKKKELKEKYERVMKIYDEVGEYTAKSEFDRVIPEFEKVLRQFPNDAELQSEYNDLINTFDSGRRRAVSSAAKNLKVESVDMPPLFPVLQKVYAENSSGFIKVTNTSKSNIENLHVTSYARKYMDFASESDRVKVLKPGETVSIGVRTILNDSVISLDENAVVQMQFNLKWESDGSEKNLDFTRPVTIYKKSAMCWDDTSMLSCFIMPNDPTVEGFVYKAVSEKKSGVEKLVSRNFLKAVQIVDGLGTLPLTYVMDPVAPTDSLVSNKYAVDTVRFPAETLSLKGGDCDDMTTLLCSSLEAAGIGSALITVPGHIMAAFNTGLKASKVWEKFLEDSLAFECNGEIWIPVETTIMQEGFAQCWKNAGARLKASEIEEFIVVSEKRNLYPPVSSDSPKANVKVSSLSSDLVRKDAAGIVSSVFAPILSDYESLKDGKAISSYAQIYHNLGKDDEAIEALLYATKVDGSYFPAFRNLASIYKSKGMTAEYERITKAVPEKSRIYVSGSSSSSKSEGRAESADGDFEWNE